MNVDVEAFALIRRREKRKERRKKEGERSEGKGSEETPAWGAREVESGKGYKEEGKEGKVYRTD